MRLIDADALANYANNQIVGITANDIMRFPTIDAEPVKRARWIKGKDWDDWFCSGCSNKADLDRRENPILSSFCPHCGAEMDFCEAKMDFCGAKEEENTRLEESFKKATVSREQFNKAANEIGDSIEDGNDKMAIAVFVNVLEERLFGGE